MFLVNFEVSDLDYCFCDTRSAAVQYLFHLLSVFSSSSFPLYIGLVLFSSDFLLADFPYTFDCLYINLQCTRSKFNFKIEKNYEPSAMQLQKTRMWETPGAWLTGIETFDYKIQKFKFLCGPGIIIILLKVRVGKRKWDKDIIVLL